MLESENKPTAPKPDPLATVIEAAENACRDASSGQRSMCEILAIMSKTGIADIGTTKEFSALLTELGEFNAAMAKKFRALAIRVSK